MGALSGKRVLVTRAREQAGSTADLLRARGAVPVVVPTIELHPPTDPEPMRRAVSQIAHAYDWLAFTSANGVEWTWREIERQGQTGALAALRIAAIGPGTAQALDRVGLRVDVVAKELRGEGLAEELLLAFGGARPRVLVARAEIARDVLPDALRIAGCSVDVVAAYATRPADAATIAVLVGALERDEIDVVMLTSGSTVDNLCDCLGSRAAALLSRTRLASIGPVTTEAAVRRGLRVAVTAPEATVAALVDALEAAR